jgi:hypothetical protein
MIDTGLFEKALQLDMMLRDNETLESFYKRVIDEFGKGIYWSLDRHCVPKYHLVAKHNLDMQSAHTAGFDCKVTHLLMEEYRNFTSQ